MWAMACFKSHEKENLTKATSKAKKGHLHFFSLKVCQLDPFMQLIRVHIHGVKVYEQLGMGPYYMPHSKSLDNIIGFVTGCWGLLKKIWLSN